ncbi:MAG: response regulator [Elusimicrobia bacterium]|nr:response regulator [Elusimicrobiota bacterium]
MNQNDKDQELRILMLEDDLSDAELSARALRQAGLKFSLRRTEDREAFAKALQDAPPDLLLVDYNLPSINGLEALDIARERCPDVPFIFVSGTMGEELAIDTLKRGATDYVLKARLSRLAPAVRRALEEARLKAERRQAEAALQESAEKYRSLVETTATGYVILDLEGKVLGANPEYVRMTGCGSIAEVRGRSVLEWTAEHGRAALAGALAQCAQSGRIRELEVDCVDARGRITPIEVNATVVTANGAAQILALCRDISQRRQAEAERARLLASERKARAEAEAASRAKDEFLAMVSHELRTPITAIMGWNWLLRSGELSAPERKRALEVIDRSVQTEKQIIDELLDVSSMVRRQLTLKKQTLDLGRLAAETAAGFQAELQAKSLRLVCEPEPDLLVYGDPRRLRQVFWNLVSNAVKFTPDGGTVTVAARRAEGRAVVSVEDTGPGISPECQGRLFALFNQQESPLTRAHGGLGLGLAIVKHLVDLHGGSVSVASPVPGRGAKISVSLPLAAELKAGAPAGAEGAEAGSPSRERGPLSGVRILVVDDDEDTRGMIASVLGHCGATAESAGSAAEAFKAFQASRPDILISDIAMPDEDGYALIRRIRALPAKEGGRVPAAALTAYATAQNRAEALRAGFQIYLPKPVDPEELVAVVHTLAGKPKSKSKA